MQSTIALFRHLYKHLPPLFPDNEKERMGHALEHLEKDQTVTMKEIEDTMIGFGHIAWPWNQAYREFLAVSEGEVGEHFLMPKLTKSAQERYLEFKAYGGSLRDLHSGHPASYFTNDERVEVSVALIDMQIDLRNYTDRKVLGTERIKYLERVKSFSDVLKSIQQKLGEMNGLAEKELDHPNLANEIRMRVRSFEEGLCLLGPELKYDAVHESIEFFEGRKKDLNRMRGIQTPLKIDFYAEEA